MPLFKLPNEPKGSIFGMFSDIKSIMEIDVEKGKKSIDKELYFPVVKLDKKGRVVFKSVGMMEQELKNMGFKG
jgi:hypothetical protein